MRRLAALAVVVATTSSIAIPQGRPVDWPSFGGDARRSGWEKSDIRITKDNVKDFKLVLKRKFEGPPNGFQSLTSPVIIGLLISYKGFKELGFVAGTDGNVWSLDVDTDRMFWHKKLTGVSAARSSATCGSVISATPTLTPPATFGGRPRPAAARPAGTTASQSPGLPPTPAGANTNPPARAVSPRIGGTGFGAPRPLYVLTSDGLLHQMNTSDGSDQFPPLPFLPANAKATSLAMHDYVIYTTTSGNCGGVPNAVYALDLREEDPKPAMFALNGTSAQGLGGLAVGNDGTVYVQTGPGESDPAAKKWGNMLLALDAKDLSIKSHFPIAGKDSPKTTNESSAVTPVVFEYKGHDVVVTASPDGRLTIIDPQTQTGAPASQTPPLASTNGGIWGGLSTWEDTEGIRWIAASVQGAVNPELKAPNVDQAPTGGAIVAFKLEEQSGKPVLTPAWVSRNLTSPTPPVVTSGIVFVLSSGGYLSRNAEVTSVRVGNKAILYALDAATGKELYSTGSQVSAPGSLSGLSIANGRVYFTTIDNTLYAFGIYMER